MLWTALIKWDHKDMANFSLLRFGLVWFGLWLGGITSASADLVLSAPPRESSDEAKRTYEPLAKFFTEIIGEQVTYVQPRDWLHYTTEMRNGKYDILFDGPHFAAWRIKHLHHVALAKLPGTLDFIVLAHWDDKRINKLRDLVALPVCGLPSPNLGTMTVMAQFADSLAEPDIKEAQGSFDDVIKAFRDGNCRAAIVRDTAFKNMSDAEKKPFKVIFKSPPFPNQTVTVAASIQPKIREKLIAALTVKKGFIPAEILFNEFSKKSQFFIPAPAAEYQGLEAILEGVVWGW